MATENLLSCVTNVEMVNGLLGSKNDAMCVLDAWGRSTFMVVCSPCLTVVCVDVASGTVRVDIHVALPAYESKTTHHSKFVPFIGLFVLLFCV